jgi:hypothetical protein
MAIVPKNPANQVEFYRTHIPIWASDPGAVGLSVSAAAGLQTRLAVAEAALDAAREARNRARAATQAFRNAARDLHGRGASAIATIKAYAGGEGGPGVYPLARIDRPQRGSPRPAPAMPINLRASVAAWGGLRLEWDAPTSGASTGVYFQVFRGPVDGIDPPLVASTSGTFHDDPRPLAGGSVYIVRAMRGSRFSASSPPLGVYLPGGGAGAAGAPAAAAHAPGTTLRSGDGRGVRRVA